MKPPAKVSPAPVGSKTSVERERGAREDVLAVEEQRAVLAALDDHPSSGPSRRIARAALTMLCSPASWRASASLMKSRSTRASVFFERRRAALDPEVHRVHRDQARRPAPGRAPGAAARGRCCRGTRSFGVAVRRPGAWAGSSAKTLSWVSSVCASLSSKRVAPFQRKVLPGTRSTPARSTPRARRNATCSSGKSSPTTATIAPGRRTTRRRRRTWRSRRGRRPRRRRASPRSRARPNRRRAGTWRPALRPKREQK